MKIKPEIEIVAGFLGAGKTSFINMLLRKTLVDGEKVVVIQNEEGNTGIGRLKEQEHKVIIREQEPSKEITSSGLQQLIDFYEPHRIIIEHNGMKVLGNLLKEIEELSLREFCREPVVYSLVDGATFDMFFTNMKDLVMPFISHGNLIVVNNSCLLEEESKAKLIESLENINRDAIIITARDTDELSLLLDKKSILSNGSLKKLRIKLLNRFRRK